MKQKGMRDETGKSEVRFRQGTARRREIENRKLEIEKESQIPAGWCACERADTRDRPYVALGGGTIWTGLSATAWIRIASAPPLVPPAKQGG